MSPQPRVLVVDADPASRSRAAQALQPLGGEVRAASSGVEAMAVLEAGFSGVVIIDEDLPDMSADTLFRWVRERAGELPVLLTSAGVTAARILRGVQDGAIDVIDKAELSDRLPAIVARLQALLPEHGSGGAAFGLVGTSRAMVVVRRLVEAALSTDLAVLVRGETGTGKELVARTIHAHGPRSGRSFVALNCAALPEGLFGGAAEADRALPAAGGSPATGRLDLRGCGTLFLDDVADLPPPLQLRILRLLQQAQRHPGVAGEAAGWDVGVVAASQRDLEADVHAGRFRADLYFRLAQLRIDLPPLRERRGDLAALVQDLLERAAARAGWRVPAVSPRLVEILRRHDFPGNVRELENLLVAALATARGGTIGIADLPPSFLRSLAGRREAAPEAVGGDDAGWGAGAAPRRAWPLPTPPEPAAPAAIPPTPPEPTDRAAVPDAVGERFLTLDEVERLHMRVALRAAHGNRVEAARLLGISRATLYRKLAGTGSDDE